VLPFTGALRVDVRVLPHLLLHLAEDGVGFTVAVPGGGCVQMHREPVTMADGSGPALSLVFGAARYALDPPQVAQCWVTRLHGASGPTSAVEIYDHRQRCATVLTLTWSESGDAHQAWECCRVAAFGLTSARPSRRRTDRAARHCHLVFPGGPI
jgi:putative hemin transport protein